jgi:hypothetical protein
MIFTTRDACSKSEGAIAQRPGVGEQFEGAALGGWERLSGHLLRQSLMLPPYAHFLRRW